MNLQTVIAKFKSYPIASVALGVTVLLILAVFWRGMEDSDLEARYHDANRSWSRIDENVFKNSVNLETHLENAESISHDVRERLIRPSQLAQNYQYFYRLEASTGVRIATLNQQAVAPRPAPPPPARGARAPAPEPEPLFSKVGYTISVTGGFGQVLDFLHALENGQHFYQIKNFSVQRSNDPGARNVTLVMNFELLGRP